MYCNKRESIGRAGQGQSRVDMTRLSRAVCGEVRRGEPGTTARRPETQKSRRLNCVGSIWKGDR